MKAFSQIERETVDVVGSHVTGCLPKNPEIEDKLKGKVLNKPKNIPRSEWYELSEDETSGGSLIKQILNQKETDMCASFATIQAMMMVWVKQFGWKAFVLLSPSDLYNRITGGRPGGSSIQANIHRAMEEGVLPADTQRNRAILKAIGLNPNHVMPMADYSARPPSGADGTRQHFRISNSYPMDDWDELMTAAYMDFPSVYGRRGHAIALVMAALRERRIYGKYANSWDGWGGGDEDGEHAFGFGYDSESYAGSGLRTYGASAIQSMAATNEVIELMKLVA